ncbi:hypothetical protein [Mesoflavibacter zeaxanthinifaciens]|uniref:hypothetical protein n=1 Tax=Mesoflavibacter zeaxanthinifaciens TaxID=393060 RepID=UPI0026EE416A|nr:hypothetical protein [Mesoflavibacter zeaxanthinifaciens]
MSKELPNNQKQNEEVDLIVFFNLIGNAINKVLLFVKSIFTGLHDMFISVARVIFLNIKIIASVLIVAVIIGYVLDSLKQKIFYSEMFVAPKFQSKYELINNISYYNSLIEVKDIDELSNHFNISEAEAKSLVDFEIEIGPESKNEQLESFNGFLKTLDSSTKSKITFEDFIENRNIYTANLFLLRARSSNYKIFKKLEKGLSTSINNEFSDIEKKKRDSVLMLEKENLEQSLVEVRKLKNAYLDVLQKESEKNVVSSNLGGTLGLQVEKTQTKEDEILNREIDILNKLNGIKKELVVNDKVFEKFSSFKEKGLLEDVWYKKYKVIFPVLGLVLLIFTASFVKFYKYVLNHK